MTVISTMAGASKPRHRQGPSPIRPAAPVETGRLSPAAMLPLRTLTSRPSRGTPEGFRGFPSSSACPPRSAGRTPHRHRRHPLRSRASNGRGACAPMVLAIGCHSAIAFCRLAFCLRIGSSAMLADEHVDRDTLFPEDLHVIEVLGQERVGGSLRWRRFEHHQRVDVVDGAGIASNRLDRADHLEVGTRGPPGNSCRVRPDPAPRRCGPTASPCVTLSGGQLAGIGVDDALADSSFRKSSVSMLRSLTQSSVPSRRTNRPPPLLIISAFTVCCASVVVLPAAMPRPAHQIFWSASPRR